MAATHFEVPNPLAVSVADGHATVRVAGDLDVLSTGDLASAFDVLVSQRLTKIEVDLRDVRRVDSMAIELLADAHARLLGRGGRLCVSGASQQVEELLRRRGLQGLLRAR